MVVFLILAFKLNLNSLFFKIVFDIDFEHDFEHTFK